MAETAPFDNLDGNSWGSELQAWPYPPSVAAAQLAEEAIAASVSDPSKPNDPVLTEIMQEAQGDKQPAL